MRALLLIPVLLLQSFGGGRQIPLATGPVLHSWISIEAGYSSDGNPGRTEIDKDLRIDGPLLGSRQNGRITIKGRATKNSKITLKISSTYYKLGIDQQKRKVFKGEGPVNGPVKTLTVQVNGQGYWSVPNINIVNRGFTETYKVVAKSVAGGNATYVTFTDEKRPNIAWD